jgi:2-desacetyl-2-hydroxyethyl bacteriochlorophyllide A dehydrogenase
MFAPAVVFRGVDDVAVQEIEMPDPGVDCVQIKTTVSTISIGTETWGLRDLFTWQKTPFPCVPGYQRVGTIVKLGSGVTGWQLGDKVMATIGAWSGKVNPFWGSHAAVANTHKNELYRIPVGVDDVDASGAVVAQVGYNAAYRPDLNPGDWVMVYGDGIIGQSAAQAARSRGAKVIMVGHRTERLSLAAEFSADAVINNGTGNVVQEVQKITGKPHVRAVIDTVQSEAAQKEYVAVLEYARGQIVYSGFTPGTAWADMALLQQRELTTHFVAGWTRARMEATLNLMAQQKVNLKPLVTHRVPFQKAAEMYRMAREKSAPFMGISFDW